MSKIKKAIVQYLEDGRIIVTPAKEPKGVEAVLIDVQTFLDSLHEKVAEMRENGDNDLRTVLMYIDECSESVKELNK